jgi:uncharacterized protein (TIGR03790 family)
VSATLSQSTAAAFPDRPAGGSGAGLAMAMTAGADGQYVTIDLNVETSPMHTRVLLSPASAAGGSVTVVRGLDDGGNEVFRVAFNAANATVTATLATGDTLTAALNPAFDWHCIELGIDADAGSAELWVNGVSGDDAGGAFDSLRTRTLWIGGVFKDYAATGTLYLDEWVVADQYIGPVVTTPTSEYGDDPARWLVVFNSESDDAFAWADHYRQARHVPYANLCGLALPSDETIDAAGFTALNDAIEAYLVANGLKQQVIGVLLGFGVPGYRLYSQWSALNAIPSMLHLAGSASGGAPNPLPAGDTINRPNADNLGPFRLTARLDAPDLNSAKALVDRAVALSQQGVGDGSSCTIWLDPYTDAAPASYIQAMADWAASVDRMKTHLPIMLSADTDPQQEVQFDAIHDDGFFWGWKQATPPAGFFAEPAGARVCCVQLDMQDGTATTLRNAQPTGWADGAVAAGYASAVGSCAVYSASSIPSVRLFFEALRRGWTLAEAWFVAQPWLRDNLFLVGDPLLTVPMPKDGWEVFGPLDRLEHLDPDAPNLATRASELTAALPTPLQPAIDQEAVYLVRRVDGAGRSEAGARSVRISRLANGPALAPNVPTWPDHSEWPVLVEDCVVKLTAAWEGPIASAGVKTVELIGQIDGGAVQVLATFSPTGLDRRLVTQQPLPQQSARYAWLARTADGAERQTPWSALITPAQSPTLALQKVNTP